MTRSDTLRLLAAIAACVLVAGLFMGGARSVTMTMVSMPWDKLAHFTTYFVLTALVYVASRSLRWAAPMAIAVGALDELHQALLFGGKVGVEDWLSNAAGVLLACMVVARTRMPMQRRANHGP
ncbi:MAG: VanZ family protein [Burkholderiales bacterium]